MYSSLLVREHTTKLFLIKAVPHNILCWELFLSLAERDKTGRHSNTVICCYRSLLSLSFVTEIFSFVSLDTGMLMTFGYFWRFYGIENFSKVTFESFDIDKILLIVFRVKLRSERLLMN